MEAGENWSGETVNVKGVKGYLYLSPLKLAVGWLSFGDSKGSFRDSRQHIRKL
jgi:hypothetical protein